jgi:hypothetical protein
VGNTIEVGLLSLNVALVLLQAEVFVPISKRFEPSVALVMPFADNLGVLHQHVLLLFGLAEDSSHRHDLG